MAQSALELGNAALFKLGAMQVTSVTGADTSKEGLALTARLDIIKRKLLRDYVWNFGSKRKVLTPPAAVTLTTPFVAYVTTNTIKFTVAAHTFVAGNYITSTGAGASQANGTFEVASVTATTVTCTAPGVTAITGTPAAGTIRLSPAFNYGYLYTLPTDCLRVVTLNEEASSERWRIEGRFIASDEATSLEINYIADITDYTAMDIGFYECFATYLAWDICDHITGDAGKKRDLWTDLNGGDGKTRMLSRARFTDAVEDPLQENQANDWIGSRFGSGDVKFAPVTVTTSLV